MVSLFFLPDCFPVINIVSLFIPQHALNLTFADLTHKKSAAVHQKAMGKLVKCVKLVWNCYRGYVTNCATCITISVSLQTRMFGMHVCVCEWPRKRCCISLMLFPQLISLASCCPLSLCPFIRTRVQGMNRFPGVSCSTWRGIRTSAVVST